MAEEVAVLLDGVVRLVVDGGEVCDDDPAGFEDAVELAEDEFWVEDMCEDGDADHGVDALGLDGVQAL